jgi:hypothetical protein
MNQANPLTEERRNYDCDAVLNKFSLGQTTNKKNYLVSHCGNLEAQTLTGKSKK